MSTKLQYTEVSTIEPTVSKIRKAWSDNRARPLEYRKNQLKQLAFMIKDKEKEWLAALNQDLGRSELESQLGDLIPVIADIKDVLKHLDKWAKPSGIPFNLIWFGAKPRVYKEPKGVVLIIGPFNYPLQLAVSPLIGAIAGGNAAVLKPSEQTPATSALLAKYLPQYLDPELYTVVNGAIDETTALLKVPFDHIFYTGSTNVGRIISKAAAEHLCPVTLELGGKSPVVILEDTDIKKTAKRILWSKALNAGQTCIAPDYLLVAPSIKPQLIQAFKDASKEFYGSASALTGNNHCKYVTPTHFSRGKKLLESTNGKIVFGGQIDEAQGKIEVTVVDAVSMDDSLMEGEIFGSILPMMDCNGADEAIRIINSRPHPLALYVFTKDSKKADYIRNNTRSGGFVHNDLVVQFTVPGLPFGGVGPSGSGNYHGKRTFDTFVHERASLSVPFYFEPFLAARYPPSAASKIKQMKFISGVGSLGFSRPSKGPQSTRASKL